jgi:hypothetical protein
VPAPVPQAAETREEAPLSSPHECEASAPENETPLAHARAAEWFERARELLLRRFARDVLARELALAPADIETLARQALAAFADALPTALSVAPADVAHLDLSLPVFADAELAPGDVVIEVGDGKLLSSLQLRVEGAIAEVLAEAAA